MLSRFVVSGLLVVACATAQAQPKPSPSPTGPARGTRAYTEEFYERYKQAKAEYDAVSADPNADLAALDAAHLKLRVIAQNALGASGDEADTYSEVKAAKAKDETAEALYQRLKKQGKDYEAELKAQAAALKAFKEYLRVKGAVEGKIEKAIGVDIPFDPPFSARHQALRDEAKRKADEDAKKKAEAEKKAHEQQNTEPKKTSCAPGSGLGGAMENVACQEQHSGAGH